MERDGYHHGNLKQALIEAGVQIIQEEGITALSLRKVAARCQVSHAAPYNHFRDKEELVGAIGGYITERFSQTLMDAAGSCNEKESLLLCMGEAYVDFFVQNPAYYYFLVTQDIFQMKITEHTVECLDFQPFALFRQAAESMGMEEDLAVNLLTMWSVVEGLTAILACHKVECTCDYRKLVHKILKEKILF